MEKEKVGVFRFRVVFDDSCLRNSSQLSDDLRCFWILLKPGIATFAELASHLRDTFALRNRPILSISDFVLPPFESTCIIKDKDIIRVTQKDAKLKNECKPCDSQNLVQDHQIAKAHGFALSNCCMTDGKSQENLQGNGYKVEENLVCHVRNAVHEGNSSCGIELLKQKRELSHELQDSKKKQKLNCTEKPVTWAEGIQDMHLRHNGTFSNVCVGFKMGLHVKDNTHDDGLADAQACLVVNLCVQKSSVSMPCQERQQPERVDQSHESESQSAFYVTKEWVRSCGTSSKSNQNQLRKKAYQKQPAKKNFKGENNGSDCHKKTSGLYIANCAWSDGNSPDKKTKPSNQKIDFATLFPLTRSPLKGDILAYRYVESSPSVYLEFSPPHVGKVSAFNYKSSEIVLVPVPEFEVFEENSNIAISQQREFLYKEDGSLEIKFSTLVDVRLLKAHDSRELACLLEGTAYRAKKDNWEAALAKSCWNQSDTLHADKSVGRGDWILNSHTNAASWSFKEFNPSLGGKEHGAKSAQNERGVSTSRASPAEALFWETILSKGIYGKG